MEKAIQSGKEKRRPYSRAKAVSTSCRNNGGCDYCKGNRLHATARRSMKAPKGLLDAADGATET
jgi:hypothetical protein